MSLTTQEVFSIPYLGPSVSLVQQSILTTNIPDNPPLEQSQRSHIIYQRLSGIANTKLEGTKTPFESCLAPTYVPATNLLEENLDLSIARRKGTWSTHNLPLIYNFLSYHRLSPFYPFVSSISSISIPTNVFEVLDHLGWRQVMVDVDGKKSIGCQWVYAIKVWANGQTGSFKARLVAKGYS